MLVYEPTGEEIDLAINWHGGQSSMLYGVASTGALSLGTRRPLMSDSRSMSDAEWSLDLVLRLYKEVSEIVDSTKSDPDDFYDYDTAEDWLTNLSPIITAIVDALDESGNTTLGKKIYDTLPKDDER